MTSSAEHYVFADAGAAAERSRLAALEQEFDPWTRRRLLEIGLASGWRCLEVGPGLGSILRWMAERVGPAGTVVAVERDARFLRDLKLANVTVHEADILDTGLPIERMDLCHARHVLLHVPDWRRALARLWAAVKPGGWLALQEPDFGTGETVDQPEGPARAVNRVKEAIRRMYEVRGIDPRLGRHLPAACQALGAVDLRVETNLPLANGGSGIARIMALSAAHLAGRYIATGACDREDVERYVAASEDPSAWVYYHTTVAVLARKASPSHAGGKPT